MSKALWQAVLPAEPASSLAPLSILFSYFVCISVLPTVCASHVYMVPTEASDTLGLELQMVLSCHVGIEN